MREREILKEYKARQRQEDIGYPRKQKKEKTREERKIEINRKHNMRQDKEKKSRDYSRK